MTFLHDRPLASSIHACCGVFMWRKYKPNANFALFEISNLKDWIINHYNSEVVSHAHNCIFICIQTTITVLKKLTQRTVQGSPMRPKELYDIYYIIRFPLEFTPLQHTKPLFFQICTQNIPFYTSLPHPTPNFIFMFNLCFSFNPSLF